MGLQRNVQQQNDDTTAAIARLAMQFRQRPEHFGWLLTLLHDRQLLADQGILARLSDIPEPGGTLMQGIWLCQDGQFWAFEVLVPGNDAAAQVERFENVTALIPVNEHLRGQGLSFGQQAQAVHRQLMASEA